MELLPFHTVGILQRQLGNRHIRSIRPTETAHFFKESLSLVSLVCSVSFLPMCFWVLHQRQKEKDGRLPEDRKEMLTQAGVDLTHRVARRKRKFTVLQENAWNEMYEMLSRFKDEHGHCKVKLGGVNNKKLAVWVNNQRISYREGKMTSERQTRLEALGFVWNVRMSEDKNYAVQSKVAATSL